MVWFAMLIEPVLLNWAEELLLLVLVIEEERDELSLPLVKVVMPAYPATIINAQTIMMIAESLNLAIAARL